MTVADTTYERVTPKITAEGSPFWEATKRGEIVTQHCPDCSKHQFPPRRLCVHCGGRRVGWKRVSGRGRVYSFTVVHRAPEPAFLGDVPYVVAVIDLEEGGRMMTNVVQCSPEEVVVGMDVEATFEPVDEQFTLVKFVKKSGE